MNQILTDLNSFALS